jgi:beta-alanine--pyruvate transaminase
MSVPHTVAVPNDLDAFWMPFTANRQFKSAPRLLVAAEGMYYRSHDGRRVLDGMAGLWCVNAGHGRRRIVKAVQDQVATMDFAPPFQMAHPKAFQFASRLVELMPKGIEHVFFSNSGSEAVETALKIAIAYHRQRGEGARTRLIGRERGYHGVNFGGISVGGMGPNRVAFGHLLAGVDHLRHTHDLARNAFSRGLPEHGAELADDLERLVQLHGASTIAAVIVEPMAGSTGVLLPPEGYLKRLRDICTRHGILLIFDEVITGFGRLGSPTASEVFGITPDILTMAKGLTNGTVPMAATFVSNTIFEAFMTGPAGAIELFHGYTYSAHPLAVAAGLATLDTYAEEGLLTRAAELAPYWQGAIHALKGLPHVIDIRNFGLVGAVELESRSDGPGKRGYAAFVGAYEKGLLSRMAGDTLVFAPPLIISKAEIDQLFAIVGDVLKALD